MYIWLWFGCGFCCKYYLKNDAIIEKESTDIGHKIY